MIDFCNVSKTFDNGTHALNNINIHIDKGEFVFIVGSSGAGKSTFLKLMMREEVPTHGTITVDGIVLNQIKKKNIPLFRRRLGIVFQDFRLIPNMTVFDNVAFAMRVIGIKEKAIRRRVPYVLTLVGLNSKARCLPQELSGGEQQRVALARALANNAEIIIADEPTGNVDPQMSYEIVDLLMKLNEAGTTVIMVTHEHSLVRCFNKRVITLDKGEVVGDGGNLITKAATAHINSANELSEDYVLPPDEDYSEYAPVSQQTAERRKAAKLECERKYASPATVVLDPPVSKTKEPEQNTEVEYLNIDEYDDEIVINDSAWLSSFEDDNKTGGDAK